MPRIRGGGSKSKPKPKPKGSWGSSWGPSFNPTPSQLHAAANPLSAAGKPFANKLIGKGGSSDAVRAYLAALAGGQAFAGQSGGGGYGGGGGGVPVDPFAGLNQAALAEILAAQKQWDARNAGLKTEQTNVNAQSLAALQAQSQAQLANYKRAIDPVKRDLELQGHSAAPVQQQAAIDEQRLAGGAARDATLSQRFAEIDKRSFADREAAAIGHTSASRMNLAQQIALMRAEMAGSGDGGGGGYGGGGGSRYGSGYLSAGDRGALGDATGETLEDFRQVALAQYGGPNQNLIQRYLFGDNRPGGVHVNANLNNVGQVQRRFVADARSRGIGRQRIKRINKQVWRPLKKYTEKASKQRADQRGAQARLNAL